MQVAKRSAALATLVAGIFAAWVARCVLRIPHKKNFAAIHKALLVPGNNLHSNNVRKPNHSRTPIPL